MTKKDLKFGMVVELGGGELCLICPEYNARGRCVDYDKDVRFYSLKNASWVISLRDYNDDLTEYNGDFDYYDIVKVYKDYTLKELLWERKEVLDDIEKAYLSAVIKPFRDRVASIIRVYDPVLNKCHIKIKVKAVDWHHEMEEICLPYFDPKTMYKGMIANAYYTLEQLGL